MAEPLGFGSLDPGCVPEPGACILTPKELTVEAGGRLPFEVAPAKPGVEVQVDWWVDPDDPPVATQRVVVDNTTEGDVAVPLPPGHYLVTLREVGACRYPLHWVMEVMEPRPEMRGGPRRSHPESDLSPRSFVSFHDIDEASGSETITSTNCHGTAVLVVKGTRKREVRAGLEGGVECGELTHFIQQTGSPPQEGKISFCFETGRFGCTGDASPFSGRQETHLTFVNVLGEGSECPQTVTRVLEGHSSREISFGVGDCPGACPPSSLSALRLGSPERGPLVARGSAMNFLGRTDRPFLNGVEAEVVGGVTCRSDLFGVCGGEARDCVADLEWVLSGGTASVRLEVPEACESGLKVGSGAGTQKRSSIGRSASGFASFQVFEQRTPAALLAPRRIDLECPNPDPCASKQGCQAKAECYLNRVRDGIQPREGCIGSKLQNCIKNEPKPGIACHDDSDSECTPPDKSPQGGYYDRGSNNIVVCSGNTPESQILFTIVHELGHRCGNASQALSIRCERSCFDQCPGNDVRKGTKSCWVFDPKDPDPAPSCDLP